MSSATPAIQAQGTTRSDGIGEPGLLRTIASSEAGGGSMRGTSNDSGESSRVAGGGGK